MTIRAVGLPAAVHLAVFLLLLPLAAWLSAGRLATRPLPPRLPYFVSVIVQQGVLLGFSLLVARAVGIDPIGNWPPVWPAAGWAAAMLIVAVATFRPTWVRQVRARHRRIYLFAPRTPPERRLWVGISAMAGIGEEISYRGVLFAILHWMTGSAAAAVAVASVAFGLAHWVQGWRGAAAITVFAAAFHGLVLATGSLHWAILVHAGYDVIAGFSIGTLADRHGLPVDPPGDDALLSDSPARTPS
ncbi:MAG: CPBP family intramembrane glutamic endopeptidase [Gemmatimonadales bacterium]